MADQLDDSKASVAELEIDGKKYTAADVKQMAEDAKNNADWRAKNTQESQSIAEQRKQYENYAKLDEYLRANPEKAQKVNDLINGKQDDSLDGLDPDQQLKAVLKELSELKKVTREEIASLRQEKELDSAKKEMEKEIDEALAKYPDAERREILLALSEGSRESIESLAKKSHSEYTDKEQKIIQKYLEKKKTKTNVAAKREPGSPPVKDKVLSFNDPDFNKTVTANLEKFEEET